MDAFLMYVGGTIQGSDISQIVEEASEWKKETFNRPVPGIRHSTYSVESFIGTAGRLTVQAEREFGRQKENLGVGQPITTHELVLQRITEFAFCIEIEN